MTSQVDDHLKLLDYLQGSLLGKPVGDSICLEPGAKCVSGFRFLEVVMIKNINLHAQGILGLGPQPIMGSTALFVPSLYHQGEIEKNMYSVSVSGGRPQIVFGGYDTALPINWHKITGKMFEWTVAYQSILSPDRRPIHLDSAQLLFDTGSSYNLMNAADFARFLGTLFPSGNCRNLISGLTGCNCDPSLETLIYFMVNGIQYPYNVAPYSPADGLCVIQFLPSDKLSINIVLGLKFFNSYSVAFDYSSLSVGLAKVG